MKKIIITLILYLSITFITTYDHFTNLTDYTFDLEVHDNSIKWLILFYSKSCKKCTIFLDILKKIMKNYPDDPIAFCLIDVDNNHWLSLRFNITRLPELKIIENGLVYNFRSIPTEQKFIDFINKQKLPEYGKPIPQYVDIYSLLKKFISLIITNIHNAILNGIILKFGININWTRDYTKYLCYCFFGLYCYIVYKIFKFSCNLWLFICYSVCNKCKKTKKDDNLKGLKDKISTNKPLRQQKRKKSSVDETPINNYTKKKKDVDVSKYMKIALGKKHKID